MTNESEKKLFKLEAIAFLIIIFTIFEMILTYFVVKYCIKPNFNFNLISPTIFNFIKWGLYSLICSKGLFFLILTIKQAPKDE